MNTYETFVTVEEHGQIHVVGAPFEAGTEVEVTIRAKASAHTKTQIGTQEETRTALDAERTRQQEIEQLRAPHQEQFDLIDGKTPSLDELLSMTVEPPHEWLNER